jgi:predicted nucleic acid-binding Zn ribbon protein
MGTRELTGSEKAAIRKLVTSMCANYDKEYGCLPLDCECYMLGKCWTGAYCKYFTGSVLPLDPALEATLSGAAEPDMKKCVVCGDPIYESSNRAKYCGACAEYSRQKRQRDYMQKKRANVSF